MPSNKKSSRENEILNNKSIHYIKARRKGFTKEWLRRLIDEVVEAENNNNKNF